ncbi:hypothetical protein KP509_37G036000 [Ceratopteris richardii]|uniref:Uncharacterized protein n=1 Tax=Ceratopteris richardii TaxID=49495 RepID=A0A8T2Q721_CERRI|nr:hypothetical protein KP509_37G036000 [Ceratopteris richardii]
MQKLMFFEKQSYLVIHSRVPLKSIEKDRHMPTVSKSDGQIQETSGSEQFSATHASQAPSQYLATSSAAASEKQGKHSPLTFSLDATEFLPCCTSCDIEMQLAQEWKCKELLTMRQKFELRLRQKKLRAAQGSSDKCGRKVRAEIEAGKIKGI